MEQSKDFLGREPLGRLLARLSAPTVAAQLINMLYNIVDRIYIGHIPVTGALALTGLGVCMPIILAVSAFAALIGYGGAPRASIFLGRKDEKAAEQVLGGCFTALLAVSAVLTAVLLLFNRRLLLAFGASGETIGYALRYMNVYALGTVFVQLTLGMNTFITAQGFAKTGMYSVLIGAALNIVLDPLFIFAFRMGVAGAAWATILSQAVSCAWVLLFLFGKKTILRIRRANLRPRAAVLWPCVKLGTGNFVMQISESVITVCFNSSLLKYGGNTAVGAMTILYSVMQFALLPLQGLAQGAQPILSYNFGARLRGRVEQTFRLLMKVSLGYSAALWALIMLLPRAFAGIFTSNADLVAFTARALRVYAASLGLFGAQVACQMTFTSIGDAGASVAAAVMRKFVLLIPLIFLLPRLWTANPTFAVYLAEPIADACAVTFTVLLFRRNFRRRLDENDRGSAPAPLGQD